MTESIGRLGDQSAVRRLTLDDTVFTYVVDGTTTVGTEAFFPAVPTEHWATHPQALNPRQRVAMSTGGLLVERLGSRVMIDAGYGELSEDTAMSAVNCGEFLTVLSALGVNPTDIDTLAFTVFTPTTPGGRLREPRMDICRRRFPPLGTCCPTWNGDRSCTASDPWVRHRTTHWWSPSRGY